MKTFLSLSTAEKLRQHIADTLCGHEKLDPRQTPLKELRVLRSGRLCGYLFQISGPRRVRLYAVWAGDEDRILFYDSMGVRFAETHLSDAPEPEKLAA